MQEMGTVHDKVDVDTVETSYTETDEMLFTKFCDMTEYR